MQIIRKHMDERRRKESEQLEATGKLSPVSGSESDSTSNVSGDSPESDEGKPAKLEDYYNTGESYMYIFRYLFWDILCCDNYFIIPINALFPKTISY